MAYVQAFGTVIGGYFRQLGVLRTALLIGSVLVMLMAPDGDTRTIYEGMGFVETVVVPTLAPLFLVGLLLDALMSRVWMSDSTPDEVARLRVIIRSELLVALVLVIAYAPFFMSIAD